jgi:hypothetical protein
MTCPHQTLRLLWWWEQLPWERWCWHLRWLLWWCLPCSWQWSPFTSHSPATALNSRPLPPVLYHRPLPPLLYLRPLPPVAATHSWSATATALVERRHKQECWQCAPCAATVEGVGSTNKAPYSLYQHSTAQPPPTQHQCKRSANGASSLGAMPRLAASQPRRNPIQHVRRSFWAIPAGGGCPHCCCCWVHCCCSAVCGGGGWGAAACCWYCHCCFPSAHHPTIV